MKKLTLLVNEMAGDIADVPRISPTPLSVNESLRVPDHQDFTPALLGLWWDTKRDWTRVPEARRTSHHG